MREAPRSILFAARKVRARGISALLTTDNFGVGCAAFGVVSPFARSGRRFEFGNGNDKPVKDARMRLDRESIREFVTLLMPGFGAGW
jgi:hypothetical protein